MAISQRAGDPVDGGGPMPGAPPDAAVGEALETSPWPKSWWPIIAAWSLGALVLAGLLVFVLRFGDLAVFVETMLKAEPLWLVVAACCQLGTYACAAAVLFRILRRSGTSLPFGSLFGLAFVELFANQAVPIGGLSGNLMVMRGLIRRGIAAPIAVAALLVAGLSYYAAYLLLAVVAFALLWLRGDLDAVWQSLFFAFALVIAAVGVAILVVFVTRGELLPARLRRWQPVARLAAVLDQVRLDMLRDVRLGAEAVGLHVLVFLLDAATLWCAGRSVGLDVDAVGAFVSFLLASVVATLSLIPLGLGTFEGASTGLLHLMGGGLEASLAATLILRGFTLWLPMLPGLLMMRREARILPPRRRGPGAPPAWRGRDAGR